MMSFADGLMKGFSDISEHLLLVSSSADQLR